MGRNYYDCVNCDVFRIELVVLLMKKELFSEGRHRMTEQDQVNWVEYEEVCHRIRFKFLSLSIDRYLIVYAQSTAKGSYQGKTKQGSHRSWNPGKVLEFEMKNSRPGKVLEF